MRYPTIPEIITTLHDREISRENMQNKNYKAFKTQFKSKNNSRLIEKKV